MRSRSSVFGLGLATIATLGLSTTATAQRVSADIHIGGYPVSGTVRIGDPRPRRVVYERVYPTRVVVEHRRGKWNPGRYKNARVVVVYYDRDCDLYFDRYRRGLEEVRVYQNDGHYFRFDDDRFDRHDRRNRHDRDWNRRDRDHDRRDGRWDNRDDDRWEHDHRH